MTSQVEKRLRELAQKLREQKDPRLQEVARRIEEFLQHPHRQTKETKSEK